jgi:lysophospholipase L1-like esterase
MGTIELRQTENGDGERSGEHLGTLPRQVSKASMGIILVSCITCWLSITWRLNSASSGVPTAMDRHVAGQGENGDWAFIGRYRKANAEFIGARIRPDVVFLGDSITDQWANFWTYQPDFARDPARVGRGIAGQTSPQILVRFGSDVINLKPRVVHIMAGTNDIAGNTGHETDEEIEGYISNMVELAQLHGIKVVLASIPPAADFFWHKGMMPAPRIRALNKRLETYAMQQKLTYADYWSVLSAPDGGMRRDFSDDGVHPSENGYLAMEPLAKAAITKALQ